MTGTELAPPFIMSSAISPTGVLAAGTADGHVWFGFGGERQPRKKSKKNPDFWKGLSDDHYVKLKVAEGPLVAMFGCFLFLRADADSFRTTGRLPPRTD